MQIVQRSVLLLGAGLEGLIQTSSERVAQQFRERLPRLAAEVGVDGVTEDLCRQLYSARSESAHGAQVTMFRVRQPPAPEGQPSAPEAEPFDNESELNGADKWAKAQELLRATVRRAIEDQEFREVFAEPRHIRARWPVEHDGRQL